MKKIALLCLFALMTACGPGVHIFTSPINTPIHANVGSPLVHWYDSKPQMDYELLYSGIAGSIMKLQYREYADGLARSSFYQELTYDLSQSKEISFRDIKLRVQAATSNEIAFEVLQLPEGYKFGKLDED